MKQVFTSPQCPGEQVGWASNLSLGKGRKGYEKFFRKVDS